MADALVERGLLRAAIGSALKRSPVVAMLGPRQCGKTTLAQRLAAETKAESIDLENPAGRRRLEHPSEAPPQTDEGLA